MQRTEISREVRQKVYQRDSWEDTVCCVFCGKPFTRDFRPEVHHYVERSRGGMGIEQNLVCLCASCHKKLHNGDQRIKEYVKMYLESKYEDWDEKSLIVTKETK